MAGPSSTLRRCFFVLALLALLCLHVSFAADHHFEGFDSDDVADDEEAVTETLDHPPPIQLTRTHSDPPPPDREQEEDSETSQPSDLPMNPSSNGLEYWDEEEFEGIPEEQSPEAPKITENATPDDPSSDPIKTAKPQKAGGPISYTVEIVCVSFLIMFAINFFTGKRENENIALAWAAKFGARDSIFDKNFSLVGVGEGDDPPLLLKEEQNVFKFYASGRRYCSGLLATMELQSRHDLISRLCNWVMRGRDEISFEVYMNEEAMDQVVFAVARRKAAKGMQKEVRDLQRYGSLLSGPPGGRKWVAEELAVISESKEVAGDLITEAVLDQVFGEKAFEKFGKGFISMHFSDQHSGTTTHKKMLLFKFALPDAKNMADMTRLVALIPYYIDLIGRYKLSSQARSKTESARSKAAQEAYKEQQNARQEALQKRKADRKKMLEEAEAKLGAEAIRKKESKDRARQAKKGMPRVRMTRAH